MLFEKKLVSLIENVEVENVKEDYKKTTRVGQYRVSGKALYKPDGTYIPFAPITDTIQDKTAVHVTGCCAGGVPVERLIFVAEAGKYPVIFDNKKEVEKVLSLMAK